MYYISPTAADHCLTYMPLAQENKEFVADIFIKVLGASDGVIEESVVDMVGKGTYNMVCLYKPLRLRWDQGDF